LQQDFIKQLHTRIRQNITERGNTVSNYTEEQTTMLVDAYLEKPTRETVDELAENLGRSTKSIIGKLSREGVYRREIYVSKTGESPVTKVEIVNNIAESLGLESSSLAGLEKSPKASLRSLEKAVAGLQEIDNYPGGLG
jgi:hypothetical protein